MRHDANIDAYFERINFSGSIAPTLQTLEALHWLHPAAIPFEALDPLIGRPVRLEPRNLEQKLLFEKRGGYGFEHNLLFKAMLEDLGFEVSALAARVLWEREDDDEERPADHMVLLVEVNGVDYLADVGFGPLTPTAPLRLRAGTEQQTHHETFRLTESAVGWQLEARIGEEFKPVYGFDTEARSFEDFVALNDRLQADSRFRDAVVAARHDKTRRITLHNRTLTIRPAGEAIETRALGGSDEIKDVLANLIGIELPPADKLDPALARVLADAPAA